MFGLRALPRMSRLSRASARARPQGRALSVASAGGGAAVPVEGREVPFLARRVFCVARNYAEHAAEMRQLDGAAAAPPSAPFFFTKFSEAVVACPAAGGGEAVAVLPFPAPTEDLHHEAELVVALGSGGRNLSAAEARACVFGYCAGADLTKRDLQLEAKEKRRPWDAAKNFDGGAPVGAIVAADDLGWEGGLPPADLPVRLSVNGEVRQDGRAGDMIYGVEQLLCELSKLHALKAGDLVFTGTPAGVGRVVRGDEVCVVIPGLPSCAFRFD